MPDHRLQRNHQVLSVVDPLMLVEFQFHASICGESLRSWLKIEEAETTWTFFVRPYVIEETLLSDNYTLFMIYGDNSEGPDCPPLS
jgi:hypothetical protein